MTTQIKRFFNSSTPVIPLVLGGISVAQGAYSSNPKEKVKAYALAASYVVDLAESRQEATPSAGNAVRELIETSDVVHEVCTKKTDLSKKVESVARVVATGALWGVLFTDEENQEQKNSLAIVAMAAQGIATSASVYRVYSMWRSR